MRRADCCVHSPDDFDRFHLGFYFDGFSYALTSCNEAVARLFGMKCVFSVNECVSEIAQAGYIYPSTN